MQPAFVARFHPSGPWRIGGPTGAAESAESVLHSDTVYAAVTSAMSRLGMLEPWLEAAFRGSCPPPVRFSSCFPFLNELRFVCPPAHLWPPAPSPKVRWKGARLLPLSAVSQLLAGASLDEGAWIVDGASQCLLPAGSPCGPFRVAVRSMAAVDRLTGAAAFPRKSACIEFAAGAGMWTLASFADEEAKGRWEAAVKASFRLLADSGLGGNRSLGWGGAAAVEFEDGVLPDLLLPQSSPEVPEEGAEAPLPETAWWLLSILAPGEADGVDWTRGQYDTLIRTGRVEGMAGAGSLKMPSRALAEGSVIFAPAAPSGLVQDVTPQGAAHPVYRAGFSLSLQVPWREAAK